MKKGDLVRNRHTVRGGDLDEHGIIVDDDGLDDEQPMVKVMWFPKRLVEYMTWMDTQDLELICTSEI